MIIIIMVISFILDSMVSILVSPNGLFLPLFSIVSLAIIHPYFKGNNKLRFFEYSAVFGLFYDIVYTDTIFMNFFVFLIVALVIHFISYLFSNNGYTNILLVVVAIIIYRFISYILLVISQLIDFSFMLLLESIYSSLILNVIYGSLLYFFVSIYARKHKIIKIK